MLPPSRGFKIFKSQRVFMETLGFPRLCAGFPLVPCGFPRVSSGFPRELLGFPHAGCHVCPDFVLGFHRHVCAAMPSFFHSVL